MVTPCPLCHTVLDGFQREIEKDMGENLDMPVLHLPQLVGLALGLTPEDLRIDRHMVTIAHSAIDSFAHSASRWDSDFISAMGTLDPLRFQSLP